MTTLTIWANPANKVLVVQLSDDPDDGTDAEQIAYLKTISVYAGLICVSDNYLGTFPATDAAYWGWDNGAVVATARPAASFAPLSAWQVRKVLNQFGLRAQVESAIATADDNTKDAWVYANEYQRNDPLLNGMASMLGMTAAQVDSMFIVGVTL